MADVFAIRNELGRFFDEVIYKQALAARRPDVELEVPVDISFKDFSKRYFLDALVARGGLIEFKASETLSPRHKAQLLHYLFLLELRHGLLVNMRPENVEREFVNATMSRAERLAFRVETSAWTKTLPGAEAVREILLALLADWGTALELALYEEALTHFMGGEARVLRRVPVQLDGLSLGEQLLRFVADGVVFKLTAFESEGDAPLFTAHARRLLQHAGLRAMLWVNIARHQITFTTLE